MRLSKRERENITPLARWMLKYVYEHGISLNILAQRSGLAAGTLRYLISDPGREPNVETCLRLANVTGKDAEEIFILADINAPEGATEYNPSRLELVQNYNTLPPYLQGHLLDVSRSLIAAIDDIKTTALPA